VLHGVLPLLLGLHREEHAGPAADTAARHRGSHLTLEPDVKHKFDNVDSIDLQGACNEFWNLRNPHRLDHRISGMGLSS